MYRDASNTVGDIAQMRLWMGEVNYTWQEDLFLRLRRSILETDANTADRFWALW